MKDFMVIANVNGVEYLTKVSAESEGGAEHKILDLSICGKHTYGVEACMAYSTDTMKTDTFIYSAIAATQIKYEALITVIEQRNEEIKRKDAAEAKIAAIENQMKELQKELAEAKAILSA